MNCAIDGQSRAICRRDNSWLGNVNQSAPCKSTKVGRVGGATAKRSVAMPSDTDATIRRVSPPTKRHLTGLAASDQLSRDSEKLACMFAHVLPKQEAISGKARNDTDTDASQSSDNKKEAVAASGGEAPTSASSIKSSCRPGAPSRPSLLHSSFIFICTLTQLALVQLAASFEKPIFGALHRLVGWSTKFLRQSSLCRCGLGHSFLEALQPWCRMEFVCVWGRQTSGDAGSLLPPLQHQPSSQACQNDKPASGLSSIPSRISAAAASKFRFSRALVLIAFCVCTLAVPHAAALDTKRHLALDLEEEEARIAKAQNLSPQCQDEKSICGYMQINSVGLNRASICTCRGRVECPLWWDRFGVQTVRHGNDMYKYCTRKPKLSPCKPNQIAYTSFGQSDFLTGRKMADVQRVHCLCPPDHILKANKTSFEMLDHSYIYGTEHLCQKPPRCTRRQTCLSIVENAEATIEKRHCRCPLGKICPKDVRLAYEKIQEEKGVLYSMRCV